MSILQTLINGLKKRPARNLKPREKYRPQLEGLEVRWVPEGKTIMSNPQIAAAISMLGNVNSYQAITHASTPSHVKLAAPAAVQAAASSLLPINGKLRLTDITDGTSNVQFKIKLASVGEMKGFAELNFDPTLAAAPGGVGVATGVVVLKRCHSQLVGVVNYSLDAQGHGRLTFSWRDSVELRDGRTMTNTGRFAKSRPVGAEGSLRLIRTQQNPPQVVIAIIAILIG